MDFLFQQPANSMLGQINLARADPQQIRDATHRPGLPDVELEHLELFRAHFGLGDAATVDTLRIEWPSGLVQEFHDVAAKQPLTIIEPPRLQIGATGGRPEVFLRGGRGLRYQIEASTNLTIWSPIGAVTVTNLNGLAQIPDVNAPDSKVRFYRARGQ